MSEDPRTGEPRRPAAIRLVAASALLATLLVGAGLIWAYALAIDKFAQASWLMAQFTTEPGSAARVLLAVAVTVIAVLVGTANTIIGYYAWTGHGWTRLGGLISAGLSLSVLLLNPIAWAGLAAALVASALLWLPSCRRFFGAWHARRHPEPVFAQLDGPVIYGPLPRYR